jgi:ComF family protein
MSERSVVAQTWDGLLDLVFPPKCLVCGAYGSVDVCLDCRAAFLPLEPPLCERCGVATEGARPLCADCEAGPGWSFAKARAAGHFSGPLRQAVLRLKYGDKRRVAEPLGRFLGEYLLTHPLSAELPDILVPVPLHPSRLRDRGFNQSALIAREAGKLLGVPVAENLLHRTRRTRPQAELHARERATNVRDAFAASESPVLRRARVLLIDDVLTTVQTTNRRVDFVQDSRNWYCI